MKQAVVKVDWLFHSTDSLAVEKHCRTHSGILFIEISPVSGVAIIGYDENLISLKNIQDMVVECGYHCRVFNSLDRGNGHGTRT